MKNISLFRPATHFTVATVWVRNLPESMVKTKANSIKREKACPYYCNGGKYTTKSFDDGHLLIIPCPNCKGGN